MDRIKQKNPKFEPVLPNPRSSQPRLPTNVDPVTIAAREEVSRRNRDYINDLTKHKEPLIKQRDELVVNKEMLERSKEQEKDLKNRTLIREKIAKIKTEIRLIETEIRATSREIERTQKRDVKYREDRDLPGLPPDTGDMDAADALKALDDGAGVFGLVLDKAAVNAEVELRGQSRIAERNQADLIKAMSEMSVHRDSPPSTPRSGSSARGSPRSGSTPRRGSSAHDDPLPPPHGLPSGRRARDSSARGSRQSRSPF
jgi:hypothetical protein